VRATATTRVDFDRILDAHPRLTDHGFGTQQVPGATAEDRAEQFAGERARLRMAWRAVIDVADWLRSNIGATKTATRHSSYHLKHVAERALGRYVSNGELITAGLLAGYPMRELDGPNALFGMRARDVAAVVLATGVGV
jgi:hypothetical protein